MSENPGLIEALRPVARILEEMEVRFYIGGSVASSYHGAARSTMDVDLVASLKVSDVDRFVSKVQGDYYTSKTAVLDAIKRLSYFNLIHLSSSFKVDIFIQKRRKFDLTSLERARLGKIDMASEFEVPIASAEDTILSKLEWYRLGNESSERQWEDVVRVLKILGGEADLAYLERNAAELNVSDLLKKLIDSTQ